MELHKIKTKVEDRGQRIDVYLSKNFPRPTSRTFIQRLIKENNILVNGSGCENRYRLKGDELIEIRLSPIAPDKRIEPQDLPIDILYEDEDVIVVNKPKGMVVHPASGNYTGTLVNALLGHSVRLSGINAPTRPGIVHRLDKGVSGLLVVAKNDQAHRALAKQFKARTVKRKYLAFVRGSVEFDSGTVDSPLGRDKYDRKKVAIDLEDGKEAVTKYKTLKRFGAYTLLEIHLQTGRTHQIRVHLASIGHPILGDVTYSGRSDFGRIALHAATIGFIHPSKNKLMEFSSELPDEMKALLTQAK